MDLEYISLHLHIAAADSVKFDQAFDAGIGRSLAQFHLDTVILYRCLNHTECPAVVRLQGHLFRSRRAALDGDSIVELLRRSGNQLAQRESDFIGLSGLQGTCLRHKAYGLGAVPLHRTLHGRFENEEALGRLSGCILCQIHPESGVFRDNPPGECLNVACEILSRRLHSLLGPARNERQSC